MARFATTRWSLIEHARTDPVLARDALETLCRDYRPPVLAYIRHSGFQRNDAEDLTQEFFVGFIERRWYLGADRERGRFRNLLLTALQRFLSDRRAHDRAAKRGGGLVALPLETTVLPASPDSPESAFTRVWALTVLNHALQRLSREWISAGREEQFMQLVGFLEVRASDHEFGQLADRLGVRHNTLAVQLHRMRARLRQLTREELLQTVGNPDALEEELAELRDSLEPVLSN